MAAEACPEPVKMVVDVDTGVDDAQSLMMALTQPHVQVLGITCVTGNTDVDQARINTLRVLRQWDSLNIPVYRGAQCSLIGHKSGHASHVHGCDGMGDSPDPDPISLDDYPKPEEHAAAAMVRIINQHPGEVTLVALAPLTNVALALHLDPDLGSKLNKCVIMGGTLHADGNTKHNPTSEFNFSCDPEAVKFVLENLGCTIQLLTWQACHDNYMDWDFQEKLVSVDTDRGRFHQRIHKDSVEQKRSKYEHYHLCDPAAMLVAIHSTAVLKSEHHFVTAELGGSLTRGQTIIDVRGVLEKKPNVDVVRKVNMSMYKEALMKMVT